EKRAAAASNAQDKWIFADTRLNAVLLQQWMFKSTSARNSPTMSCSEHLHPKRFSGTRLLPVLLTALLWLPGVSAQPAPKVTLLVPAPEGGSICWTQMTGIMRAAAEDLGIDLTLVYSRNISYSEKKDGLAA